MTTRAELESKLEEQRKRRQSAAPLPAAPAPPKKKNMPQVIIGLILLIIGTVIFFAALSPMKETKNEQPAQSSTTPALATPLSETPTPAVSARTILMRVCTDVSNGRMQVHFAPGAGSEIRGYLREAEAVEVSERRSQPDGGTWLRLTSPMDGWANARLLCPQENAHVERIDE